MSEQQAVLKGDEVINISRVLPVIPVRDIILFPYSVVPLLVGRQKSLRALEEAETSDNLIMIVSQKDPELEEVKSSNVFRVGTVAKILQVMELPSGYSKVVVEGIIRARITRFLRNASYINARIQIFDEEKDLPDAELGLLDQLIQYFQEYISLSSTLPEEMLDHLKQQGDPYRMVDFVALNIDAPAAEKQKILAETDIEKRLQKLIALMQSMVGFERLRQKIDMQVQERLVKNQRNYYLQEKLKIINQELGEEDEAISPELQKLEKKIEDAKLPSHAFEKATEELNKLKKIPPFSPEYTVIRNYLEWIVQVPWSVRTKDKMDIRQAERILNEDHFGLEKPKERIIEHLAVLHRVKKIKGPILCFVGPPGVGKTSLGKSIARALGRKFVRVSLGGIRDEAEIRGHRRTYIGALPGKIIQSMKKVGSRNPVFLMDEVDKMSADFRGDPASALLEVLDPEQNRNFNDHYLDVDYDLSEVFFITTANLQSNIPLPLQDRMEIIELPGYLEHEKLKIAELHLIPKQMAEHGLTSAEIEFKQEAILRIIREYTREAGVRNLERNIANICRKAIRKLSENKKQKRVVVDGKVLEHFLGKPPYLNRQMEFSQEIGVATGLAWTAYGGEILKIEVNVMPGKGKLTLTGKLGDVMQESAQTALSYVRSISASLGLTADVFEKNDIHVHIPEGAIPKDGPSAGITIATAMISALTSRPVRNDIAMSGEITLRGKVLAIGGLNEKMLAAQRNKIPCVILPDENKKDVEELPEELRQGIQIIRVTDYQEVLKKVIPAKANA